MEVHRWLIVNMARHKQSEFAGLCGLSNANLSTNKSRGKVVVGDDGLIDDTKEPNKSFLIKWAAIKAEKEKEAGADIKIHSLTPVEQHEKPVVSSREGERTGAGANIYQLDLRKKALDIEKTTEEIALLQIRKEKFQGLLIPTELIKPLIARHSKAISTAFSQAADNLLVEFGAKKKLSSKEQAEMRGVIIKLTNKAIEEAIAESKKGIANIVKEYSETRSRGEKKA